MKFTTKLVRLALVTAGVLLVPLVAMRFTDEVAWTPFDFVAAAALLFGAGLTFELVACRGGNTTYRVATGLAVAGFLLLIWLNLAVGLIGSEDDPANGLYVAVLVVVIFGAPVTHLRATRMARVMYAAALTQFLVPFAALLIFRPSFGAPGLGGVLLLNMIFVGLFCGSAELFRVSGRAETTS